MELGLIIMIMILCFNVIDFIIRGRTAFKNKSYKNKDKKCLEEIKSLETMTTDLLDRYKIIEDRVDAFQVHLSRHIDFGGEINNNIAVETISKHTLNPTPVDKLHSFKGSTRPSDSVSSELTNLMASNNSATLFEKREIHKEIYNKERKQWYVIRKMLGHDAYKQAYKRAYQRLYYNNIIKSS